MERAVLPGESSLHAESSSRAQDDDGGGSGCDGGGRWYFSRKEIEENAPSRNDAIDLKKETYLRKSYCTFLQDLGMRLKVPQITIATSIIFCHRFFIRQSHAKNDRRTIATVCMFLAGKVEETPRPLKDVILVSYDIIHKKDPVAAQRIKQKDIYEQQKELILVGERVVLATLGFDLNVVHPYKPLVDAIKKFKVAQNALAQVAWNFVNDGLRTSLCLQFKPHHIAAGAIFLAAKFLKVKLPSDGEKVWWQEFDVTPRQLEEVSNQMLELYEQNRAVPPSQGSEVEGSAGAGPSLRAPARDLAMNEEHASRQTSSRSAQEHSNYDNHGAPPRTTEDLNNDNGSAETESVVIDPKVEVETKDGHYPDSAPCKELSRDDPSKSRSGPEQLEGEDGERTRGRSKVGEAGEWKDDTASCTFSSKVGRNLDNQDSVVGHSPKDAIKLDKDKVKAKFEKQRKSRGEVSRRKDVMDEDDLIEMELEGGIELAAEDDKMKQERRQSWSKTDNSDYDCAGIGDDNYVNGKEQSMKKVVDGENTEEGEMLDEASSPMVNSRKRKGSPCNRMSEGKKWQHDNEPNHNHDHVEDGHKMNRGGGGGYDEREHRRHVQGSHL